MKRCEVVKTFWYLCDTVRPRGGVADSALTRIRNRSSRLMGLLPLLTSWGLFEEAKGWLHWCPFVIFTTKFLKPSHKNSTHLENSTLFEYVFPYFKVRITYETNNDMKFLERMPIFQQKESFETCYFHFFEAFVSRLVNSNTILGNLDQKNS